MVLSKLFKVRTFKERRRPEDLQDTLHSKRKAVYKEHYGMNDFAYVKI